MSKKLLMFPICVVFAMAAFSTPAFACSCVGMTNVLNEFERAELVFTARVASVDADGSATTIAEKVYKGDFKAGTALKFDGRDGGNCAWGFGEGSIGREFLFYVNAPSAGSTEEGRSNHFDAGKETVYVASICSRSRSVESAADDLAYLDNLKKVTGKTRLSGIFASRTEPGFNAENITLTIAVGQKTITAKTSKDGFFEIYDLPEGTYDVHVEMPFGWKAEARLAEVISLNFDPFSVNASGTLIKKVRLKIRAGKHTAMNLDFVNDTAIKGRVLSPEGKGMKGVCVTAIPTESIKTFDWRLRNCTNVNGDFVIEMIPRGHYRLVANEDGRLSGDVPFGSVYYPGVTDIADAEIIAVEPGRYVTGKDIQVLQMDETVTFRGRFLYSDGKPVLHESVNFTPDDKGSYGMNMRSDLEGRFEFKLLKGAAGTIQGEMLTYAGEFENCPPLESLIKESGSTFYTAKTTVVKVNTLDPQELVDVSFPFPSCKKAKQ